MPHIISTVVDLNEDDHRIQIAYLSLPSAKAAQIDQRAALCQREELHCVQWFDSSAEFLSGVHSVRSEAIELLLEQSRTSVDLSMCVVEKDCFSYQACSRGSSSDPGFRTRYFPLSVLRADDDAVFLVTQDYDAVAHVGSLSVQVFQEVAINS